MTIQKPPRTSLRLAACPRAAKSAPWRPGAGNRRATAAFLVAASVGHDGYADGQVNGGGLIFTLIGWGILTLGSWLGGSIVFVHGTRVLNLVEEPALRAATPGGEEKEAAEGA